MHTSPYMQKTATQQDLYNEVCIDIRNEVVTYSDQLKWPAVLRILTAELHVKQNMNLNGAKQIQIPC